MATPFIGTIRMFGGNFPPIGHAFCNGQLQSIDQNSALFALIGTIYGGDGQTTFALPDLRGRMPVHQGTLAGGATYVIGQQAGTETVTLTAQQMPTHTHTVNANANAGDQSSPAGNFFAGSASTIYSSSAPNTPMNSAMTTATGGNQAHENMSPFLAISFIIALEGIFPSRN